MARTVHSPRDSGGHRPSPLQSIPVTLATQRLRFKLYWFRGLDSASMGNDLIQIGNAPVAGRLRRRRCFPRRTSRAAPVLAAEGKTFYFETFGCQMNVHDSEKVAGVLMARGYRPVDSHQEADIILYNTCSIREKAAQKVFSRLGAFRKAGSSRREDHRRAGLRGAAGRRALFRARAAGQPGVRFGELCRSCRTCWRNSSPETAG